jgi:formate hydrogenlyase subunit 6/NADH:ubiquinone oxidoreductase subunit I
MVCVRECPAWCLSLQAHPEVVPATREGRRPVTTLMLDDFVVDYALCQWCSICVEVCPYDALAWTPLPPAPTPEREGLLQSLMGTPRPDPALTEQAPGGGSG